MPPEPQSRRARPAKAPLSRAAIVAAARVLIEETGAEKLTMRKLAAVLDTGAASLYVYFRNTDELYAEVLDELLGTVSAARGSDSWRDRLLAVLVDYTTVLFGQPVLARTALFTHPSGPNSLALIELLLALLDEGGVPHGQAAWGVDLLIQRATATAAEHGGHDEDGDLGDLAHEVLEVSPDTHPHLAAAGADLFAGEPLVRLRWSFDVLLNGVIATPRP